MSERTLLDVQDLRVHIPTPRGTVRAVDGVSLRVVSGMTVAIVGESGSGKSMLVRSCIGLAPRAARVTGRVLFDGKDVLTMEPSKLRRLRGTNVAIVLQDPTRALNPVVRIQTQVVEALRYHQGVGRGEARRIALELLESMGVSDPARRMRQYPGQLSGGMQQRVAIAAALACNPRLLLADEITSSLDVTVGAKILDLLGRQQSARDLAVVMVTHDLSIACRRSDEIVVMYGSKLMERAPAAQLADDPRHPYTAALLRCSPQQAQPGHSQLDSIRGQPIDPVDASPGCRFAARCEYVRPRCRDEDPEMRTDHAGRSYACFYPLGGTAVSVAPAPLESDGPVSR